MRAAAEALAGAVSLSHGAVETLEYPARATGAPLVLLHEGLGSVGLWRSFPKLLWRATGRRLIVYSRHRHGHSGGPGGAAEGNEFFRHEALIVLPELLDRLGVRDPLLVGHSDGASIALVRAGTADVAGLVLIAPHVFVEPMTLAGIEETRRSYVDGGLRERLARHHDDPDAVFWRWCDRWLDPAFRDWSLEAEVARVTAPTLLVQGTGDRYGTLEQLDRIEAGVQGPVRRLLVPGGHSPQLEHPNAAVAAIAEWLGALA